MASGRTLSILITLSLALPAPAFATSAVHAQGACAILMGSFPNAQPVGERDLHRLRRFRSRIGMQSDIANWNPAQFESDFERENKEGSAQLVRERLVGLERDFDDSSVRTYVYEVKGQAAIQDYLKRLDDQHVKLRWSIDQFLSKTGTGPARLTQILFTLLSLSAGVDFFTNLDLPIELWTQNLGKIMVGSFGLSVYGALTDYISAMNNGRYNLGEHLQRALQVVNTPPDRPWSYVKYYSNDVEMRSEFVEDFRNQFEYEQFLAQLREDHIYNAPLVDIPNALYQWIKPPTALTPRPALGKIKRTWVSIDQMLFYDDGPVLVTYVRERQDKPNGRRRLNPEEEIEILAPELQHQPVPVKSNEGRRRGPR